MTQVFDENGRVRPATILNVSPMTVTQIKSEKKDGYDGVQFGYGTRKEKNINKPQKAKGSFAGFKEAKGKMEVKLGDNVDVDSFEVGDEVEVSSISKGKGFQGVVKRHGFAGGPRSHGQKHSEREPGSIGATGPQRVFKGKRMAGRMGGERVTVKNLRILQVDKDNGILVISGAVPGRRGTSVEVWGK